MPASFPHASCTHTTSSVSAIDLARFLLAYHSISHLKKNHKANPKTHVFLPSHSHEENILKFHKICSKERKLF